MTDNSYVERPISRAELAYMDSQLTEKFRLGNVFAKHELCGHVYRTKRGGRKERYLINSSLNSSALNSAKKSVKLDDLTCSVCFKLRISDPKDIPKSSLDICIVENPNNEIDFRTAAKKLTREFIDKKFAFYKWLYQHDYVDPSEST